MSPGNEAVAESERPDKSPSAPASGAPPPESAKDPEEECVAAEIAEEENEEIDPEVAIHNDEKDVD